MTPEKNKPSQPTRTTRAARSAREKTDGGARRTSAGGRRKGTGPGTRTTGMRTATARTKAKPASSKKVTAGPGRTTGKRTQKPAKKQTGRAKVQARRESFHFFRRFLLLFVALFLGMVGFLGIAYARTTIPSPESIALAQKTTVYYSDGVTPIGSFSGQNRQIIPCTTLPSYVGNAVVASENRTFWTDSGIDLRGIARALVNNVATGSRQGGSTITQQYAERYYLGETTSYPGKVKEALLALKIAQTQDKGTVLCNYLNTIYFGRGAYGIQAAAQAYFHEDAQDLTVDQAALLAGIIPAPSLWDPAVSPRLAQARFSRVIRIMKEDGYISQAQAQAAAMPGTAPAASAVTANSYAGEKGYLMAMVRQELLTNKAAGMNEEAITNSGNKIITTVDKNRQALMRTTVDRGKGANAIPDSVQVGGLSADPRTGAILALYAGDDYLSKQLNNVTQATFEPGSTMKAFTLLAAISQGCNLSTRFNGDSPRTFPGLPTPVRNYGNSSYGKIDLYQAMAHSVNTVFVDLNQKLGPQNTALVAKKAGIDSGLSATSPYNALGIDGITLRELTQSYATFANQGVRVGLHLVQRIQGADGTILYRSADRGTRVFDSGQTALLTHALQKVMTDGTGRPAAVAGHAIVGKSGTANDNKAAAFVGYTPSLVTSFAIWSPAADGSSAVLPSFGPYSAGEGYPTHLFGDYMRQALAGAPNENFPPATDLGKIGGPKGSWGD